MEKLNPSHSYGAGPSRSQGHGRPWFYHPHPAISTRKNTIMDKKIRVAIAGGTGYTGGELFRILLNHPNVEIVAATTTSSEGTPVASVHRDLIGETDLCFGKELNDPDVIFLCLGHGISRQFVDTHDIKPECRIIE